MFEIIFSDEAENQLAELPKIEYKKAFKALEKFEQLGKDALRTRDLGNGLFEIKPDNVRILYSYFKDKIIIVGFIYVKKSQKAPSRYLEKARNNIKEIINKLKDGEK